MFDDLGSFDQAFAADGGSGSDAVRPLRRRKTLKQQLTFYIANAIVLPLIATCYLTISADGLRQLMGVFATKLWKTPLPGAGLLRNYDGWDRLDIASVMSLILFGAVAYLWYRLFAALMTGEVTQAYHRNPILAYLLAGMASVIVLGDCGIFYLGLAAKATSSWSATPSYVPLAATIIYMAGLALIGAWHADYHMHSQE